MNSFNDLVVMIPVVYLMNNVDWTAERNILLARIGYGLSTAFIFSIYFYVLTQVKKTKNTNRIMVPKQPTGFNLPK